MNVFLLLLVKTRNFSGNLVRHIMHSSHYNDTLLCLVELGPSIIGLPRSTISKIQTYKSISIVLMNILGIVYIISQFKIKKYLVKMIKLKIINN